MITLTAVSNYLDILKSKFPALFLTIYTVLTTSLYGKNSCDVVNTKENKTSFLIYYSFLCVMCFAWEVLYSWIQYTKNYSDRTKEDHMLYSIVSGFLGCFSFVIVTYVMGAGFPFSCFFDYSSQIALVIWAIGTLSVAMITYCEHLHWSKLVKGSGLL